jgi:hypothetical protein
MRGIQFVSDRLVDQIAEGRKTASVVCVGEVDVSESEYERSRRRPALRRVRQFPQQAMHHPHRRDGTLPLGHDPGAAVARRDEHKPRRVP